MACAVQSLSRHRLSSSPFFTSQQRTSSFAAANAWPAPVVLLAVALLFEAQTTLEDAEVTTPKV